MYTKFKCFGPKLVFGDFNSRIHRCQAGEDYVFGTHCFGIDNFDNSPLVNRSLLFEFCSEADLQVANTFFNLPDDQLVTYRDLGVLAFSEISFPNFAQLDYVLVPREWSHIVYHLTTTREAQLRS